MYLHLVLAFKMESVTFSFVHILFKCLSLVYESSVIRLSFCSHIQVSILSLKKVTKSHRFYSHAWHIYTCNTATITTFPQLLASGLNGIRFNGNSQGGSQNLSFLNRFL